MSTAVLSARIPPERSQRRGLSQHSVVNFKTDLNAIFEFVVQDDHLINAS